MKTLEELMCDLYDFSLMAEIGPRERLSFWYSGMELATDPSEVTRRLALVCDLLVLSHTERSKPVPFMVMPCPPDFWSPRIGAFPAKRLDPQEASTLEASKAKEEPQHEAPQTKSSPSETQPTLPEQEPGPLAPRRTPGGAFAIARITDEPYPEAIYGWLFEAESIQPQDPEAT